jgi:hypothetical protein
METKKSTPELRKEVIYKMNNIPDWINTKSSLHFDVWNLMTDCNDMILILINDRIITDKNISKIMYRFDEIITTLLDVLVDNERIKLCIYFTQMIDFIKDLCLEEERYEVCSNIQKFSDSYYTNLDMKYDEG